MSATVSKRRRSRKQLRRTLYRAVWVSAGILLIAFAVMLWSYDSQLRQPEQGDVPGDPATMYLVWAAIVFIAALICFFVALLGWRKHSGWDMG